MWYWLVENRKISLLLGLNLNQAYSKHIVQGGNKSMNWLVLVNYFKKLSRY